MYFFAAYEHIQDLAAHLRERFHVAKSICAANSPGTWRVREQEPQNPGNVLPQQDPPGLSAELQEELRVQKSQTGPSKTFLFVSVVLPGSLLWHSCNPFSPNGSVAVLMEIN